ncbi:MAG: hypothetical protein EOP51_19720, partial [Sphingobacteriales bacterium]
MKRLLFSAAILCGTLASCSKYQLNVISSTNGTKSQETGEYEFENDSVKISYSFYGAEAPVAVNVYNKLNQPLYIDWQKSALVINERAVSYLSDNVKINGTISAETDTYNRGIIADASHYTNGTLNANATLPKSTTFLPPHSQSTNRSVQLVAGFLAIPDSVFKYERAVYTDQGNVVLSKVKAANFSEQDSPLKFKSYLTLYTITDNQVKPIAYEHDFFISKSIA